MTSLCVGPYELLVRLAAGRTANVFLARPADTGGAELFAVKILRPELGSDPERIDRLLGEARLGAVLNHPEIVRTRAFGQASGVHYLVTEFVNGVSLASCLEAKRRPMPADVAIAVVRALARGLGYAHGLTDSRGQPLGIVHRDVSPTSVLLGSDGGARLGEFGMAKAAASEVETRVGVIVGRDRYMSPEQAAGELVDARSDLFALGILLWEMLTGRSLFSASAPLELFSEITERPIVEPSRFVSGLSRRLDQIVLKALARDVDERPATAAELEGELADFARSRALDTSPARIGAHLRAVFADRLERQDAALWGSARGDDAPLVAFGPPVQAKDIPVIPAGATHPDPLGLFGTPPVAASPPRPSRPIRPPLPLPPPPPRASDPSSDVTVEDEGPSRLAAYLRAAQKTPPAELDFSEEATQYAQDPPPRKKR